MFDKIFVCLDGSPLAEKIVPLAQNIAKTKGATLELLKVVEDSKELSMAEGYMRERATLFEAQIRFLVSPEPAAAIVEELAKNPHAMPAITTHGRTAWAEALVGSVALSVLRGAKRPVLLMRPLPDQSAAPSKISTVTVAFDSSEFSEKILPFAVEIAKLSARLLLIQALRQEVQAPALGWIQGDVLESSYLHARAAKIKEKYHIDPDWDVLHGEATDAICRYLHGRPETLLAMTSHARSGLKRALLGSVAAACIRNAGVPILLYWPDH
jgi:nucleotide-binding universal stress UspA family protein